MKKNKILLIFLFLSLNFFSQENRIDYKFGFATLEERNLKIYPPDSTANAVVLYEYGYSDFFEFDDRVFLRSKITKKIKILKSEGKEYADIDIYLYKNDQRSEKIRDIRAITYYNGHRYVLKKENIFRTKVNDRITKVSFAMPEVHEGSLIEYTYTTESPFVFNLIGWQFQEAIPKIESLFMAKIPGNYTYNRNLVGTLPLDINNSELVKDCFRIPGTHADSDCELLTYSMKDIPAFVNEDFMTSEDNFKSRIAFELSKYQAYNGQIQKFTTDWRSVDKDFKKDQDIGGQLKRKSFFEDALPTEILNEQDELTKAKKIYTFIQNHYTWNGKYHLFRNANVKKAFKENQGTVGEINISLINALDAAGIEVKMGLLSTRNNGFPTKVHPVISDFNYLIARVTLDEKTYLLDATEKNNPFGVLPFRCLNHDVRVMDFKNGSFWEDIIPIQNSLKRTNMLMKMNENGDLEGQMRISHLGYNGIKKRISLQSNSEESYIENLEDNNDMLFIDSYKALNTEDLEKTLTENYSLKIENDFSTGNKIYLNPFLFDKIKENPFKMESRSYPVDFGYPRKVYFMLTLDIPENFEIESMPKGKSMKLPENSGQFSFKTDSNNSKINISFNYSLKKSSFHSGEYNMLKQFFKEIILSQSEPIVLKRISVDE